MISDPVVTVWDPHALPALWGRVPLVTASAL